MLEDVVLGGSEYAGRMIDAMQRATRALVNADEVDDVVREDRAGTQLHNAVCAYVGYLKGAGLPPEQVVVLVKQSVVQFESTARAYEMRTLTDRVISLCIEAYYRP